MGKIIEEKKAEKNKEEIVKTDRIKNVKNKIRKKGIEELLVDLRIKNGLSRIELVYKLNDSKVTEKKIKRWEIGLEYPDLDIIYKLSEVYKVPSEEFLIAKNNSYEKGLGRINKKVIRWFVYTLNVSFYIGVVLTIILYILTFILALWFFVTAASQAKNL